MNFNILVRSPDQPELENTPLRNHGNGHGVVNTNFTEPQLQADATPANERLEEKSKSSSNSLNQLT